MKYFKFTIFLFLITLTKCNEHSKITISDVFNDVLYQVLIQYDSDEYYLKNKTTLLHNMSYVIQPHIKNLIIKIRKQDADK